MSSPHRAQLLAQAAQLLLAAHVRLKVTLETPDGIRLEVPLEPGERLPGLEGVSGLPAGHRLYSQLEARIVGALDLAGGWVTTARLAEVLSEANTTEFRAIVRNLSEVGIVETSTRHGVRLGRKGAGPAGMPEEGSLPQADSA